MGRVGFGEHGPGRARATTGGPPPGVGGSDGQRHAPTRDIKILNLILAGPRSDDPGRSGSHLVANSAILPRMPFRNLGLSSVDICLASSTASEMATGSSISPT